MRRAAPRVTLVDAASPGAGIDTAAVVWLPAHDLDIDDRCHGSVIDSWQQVLAEIGDRWTAGNPIGVAADGGAHTALVLGRLPEVVVGDLDSLDDATRERLDDGGVGMIVAPRDKDASDLDLAIAHVAGDGSSRPLLVVGGGGGRVDHLLFVGAVLASAANARRVVWHTGSEWVTFATPAAGPVVVDLDIGSTVSLVPMGGDAIGVDTSGLRWPIDHERVRWGSTRSLSNVAVSSRVAIGVAGGVLGIVISAADADGEAHADGNEESE